MCCTKETNQAAINFFNYLLDPQVKLLIFNWAQSALYSLESQEIIQFKEKLLRTDFQVWKDLDVHVIKAAYRTGYNMSPTMGNHDVNAYEGGGRRVTFYDWYWFLYVTFSISIY